MKVAHRRQPFCPDEVGYGHIHPLTFNGKLFCIIYATLGIPFTLVFLSATVQRLLDPTRQILAFFFAWLGSKMPPFHIRVLHLIVMSVCFVIAFLLIPSVIFYYLEDGWSLLDGFYFVFISLTTIGLGDYIPGDDESQSLRDVYKVAVAGNGRGRIAGATKQSRFASISGYLLLGLVFMTLTATVLQFTSHLLFMTAYSS